MNILGMGPAELLLIFVIALLVLGPGKLPELARTLGKLIRELRRMSLEVTAEFTKELRDMEAISREVKETADTIQQAADIKRTLLEPLEPALPSTDPSTAQLSLQAEGPLKSGPEQSSGYCTTGDSREEPKSSDAQETPAPVKAEKDTSDDEATHKGERD